ncbi:MAG: hypothetical protein ACK5M3_13080 [Dysgonomonas sp.]
MNKNRIYWKKGLDITPEIFIDADTHNLHRLNTIGNLATRQVYGILDTKFHIKAEIRDKYIYFDELVCLAVTPAGYIIDIDRSVNFDRVPLQGLLGKEYYITLKTVPYLMEDIPEKTPYSRPGYYMELSSREQEIDDGITVLKIESHLNRSDWEIVSDYLPPLVSVRLHQTMVEKLEALKQKLNIIIEKLKEDKQSLLQLRLLSLELNHLSSKKPAYEYIILFKKMFLVLEVLLENKFEVSELLHLNRFIDAKYDHNDVASILNLGWICLEEMDQKAVTKERLLLSGPPPPPPPPPPPSPPPSEILPKI